MYCTDALSNVSERVMSTREKCSIVRGAVNATLGNASRR